ncbi:MAG: hypothetical protein AB7F32_11895 [Victivallaceae bacterium]
MNFEAMLARAEFLRGEIEAAELSYWTFGFSKWTDTEYDAMVREWQRLTGADHRGVFAPVVLSTQRVMHTRPMLSMQKAFSAVEVECWARSLGAKQLMAMPKYDGCALVKYLDGTVATHGNGFCGLRVSDAEITFARNERPGYGEMIIDHNAYYSNWKNAYKSPRAAVSAALNCKNQSELKRQLLADCQFARYDAISLAVKPDAEHIAEAFDSMFEYGDIYPMDGVVFRVADAGFFERLSHNGKYWIGQIALKSKLSREN